MNRAHGVSPSAVVSSRANLGEGVLVGPGAVIEEGAEVGDGAVIGPCAYVGPDVVVGAGCIVEPGAVLLTGTLLGAGVVVAAGAVLGTDGFGYVLDAGRHRKIPQVGRVEVGDHAVIGPGACLDRATTGATSVGREAVIGAMVQIGHNVRIGDRSRIQAQVGIAGSSAVGADCEVGMQAGLAMRSELGDGCRLADRSGALRKFPPGQDLAGFPARPKREFDRMQAALHRLPKTLEALERLKKSEEGTR